MSGWPKPTEGEVAKALSAIGEPSLRRLFFRELANPEWLKPLARLGAFADPGITETDDGIRAWPWPEGDYLLRVASEEPTRVTELIKKLADSKNPWVQRMIVEIAAALPLDQLVRLVPEIAGLVQAGPDRVDETTVASLIERLLDNDRRKDARKLLGAMFNPIPGGEEEMGFGRRRRISSPVDEYWYKELLARLAPRLATLGLDGLRMAAGWLTRAIEIRADGLPDGSYGIWRPSIAPHGQNAGLYEIDDALIDTVRDVAYQVTTSSGTREAIDFLNSAHTFLGRRIAIEVAALAASHASDEVRAAGYDLLLDPTLLDLDARPEYTHLVHELVPNLSEEQLEQWRQLIMGDTWLPSEDRLRRLAAYPDDNVDSVTTEQIERERRRLRHRLLSAFSSVLVGDLAETFESLEQEFGELQHAEFTSYMESFTGPTSPLSAEDLAAMETTAIGEYLARWLPDDSHHWGPSVEGLSRVLEGVVGSEPTRFEELHSGLPGLRPAYARAIISGWNEAAKSAYEPNTAVWDALAQLSLHHVTEQIPDENVSFDDDPRWENVHRALADLATTIADRPDIGFDQLEQAWRVLKPLTNHFDPTPAHEDRYGGSNMDPLTLSLNTVRPEALRGALHLLTALTRVGTEPAITLRAEVLAALALHVGPSQDPSLAVAAVFGEGIGRIWNVDEQWVSERADALLLSVTSSDGARRAWADVVVSVALRVYQASPPFLRLMRPGLEAIFSSEYASHEHTDGWREDRSATQSGAFHVIWTVAMGTVKLDDPLVTALFSGVLGPEVLAEALGHLGWQLMHISRDNEAAGPPAEFLANARGLVEWRLGLARAGKASYEELRQFHWWVKSDAFPIDWWLPILAEITDAGVSLDKTFIGESLEEAAVQDPLVTIKVFERLLGDTDYWRRYDLLQHAARIIAAALASDRPDAVASARSLMDSLAREGYVDITDQVDRLLDPNTTQA
jgi:hypothetical protein